VAEEAAVDFTAPLPMAVVASAAALASGAADGTEVDVVGAAVAGPDADGVDAAEVVAATGVMGGRITVWAWRTA
jgi:hypothetical protein